MADVDSSKELYDFLKGDSVEYRLDGAPQSWSQSDIDSFCAALKTNFSTENPVIAPVPADFRRETFIWPGCVHPL